MNRLPILQGILFLLLGTLIGCREEVPPVLPEVRFPVDISAEESEENAIFEFPIVLSVTSTRDVVLHYETRGITATAGEDFLADSGSVTLSAGVAQAVIEVPIVVDNIKEDDEQFKVVLTGAKNATFANGFQQAIGTIKNDDSVLGVTSEGYTAANTYEGKTLVWSDEFDGDAINLDNWTYDLGGHGWGNQELQVYTNSSDNAYVANGNLMIVAEDEGSHYTSARLKSIGLQEFQYGRVDVRAVLPQGQGIWPAIWMLGANFPSAGWPACGEIDIMELIGSSPNVVHGTVHYGDSYQSHQYVGNGTSIGFAETFSDEFHVFSIEWNEEGIEWFLDDVPFFSVDNDVSGSQNYPFHEPFFFIMNVAVGGLWPGYPDATTSFPQFMAVDYVRVYQ